MKCRFLKSAEHLKRHPLGKIPVLTDGGRLLLHESGAIVLYLLERFGAGYTVRTWAYIRMQVTTQFHVPHVDAWFCCIMHGSGMCCFTAGLACKELGALSAMVSSVALSLPAGCGRLQPPQHDAAGRAALLGWAFRGETELCLPLQDYMLHRFLLPPPARKPDIAAAGLQRCVRWQHATD